MTREEVYERLNIVFRDVFDDETITVNDNTTAENIEGWDSLMHITLISSVEDEFNIKFAMKDVITIQNVGNIVDIIISQNG